MITKPIAIAFCELGVPGWIIAGAGALGYTFSETKIIGPVWNVVLLVAALRQLAIYTSNSLKAHKSSASNTSGTSNRTGPKSSSGKYYYTPPSADVIT